MKRLPLGLFAGLETDEFELMFCNVGVGDECSSVVYKFHCLFVDERARRGGRGAMRFCSRSGSEQVCGICVHVYCTCVYM